MEKKYSTSLGPRDDRYFVELHSARLAWALGKGDKMENQELAKINFKQILNYNGQPQVRNRYSTPIKCQGYCISCEESGLLARTGGRLDLMSHGCDSSDFEAVLGQLPVDGVRINQPVLFLLENPGADYGNGAPVDYCGFRKQPPVNHYYWTPNIGIWPDRIDQFNGNFYGPYFAYLMKKYQLGNVYITNLIKCKWIKDNDSKASNDDLLRRHCIERYLKKEIDLFSPIVVFCFGRKAEKRLKKIEIDKKYKIVYLFHPKFIGTFYRTKAMSQQDAVQQNDNRIQQSIEEIA